MKNRSKKPNKTTPKKPLSKTTFWHTNSKPNLITPFAQVLSPSNYSTPTTINFSRNQSKKCGTLPESDSSSTSSPMKTLSSIQISFSITDGELKTSAHKLPPEDTLSQ